MYKIRTQKTVSGAFDFIGDKFKSGFNFLKKQVTGGVDKLKKTGIAGDIEARQAEIAKIQADLGKTGRARRAAIGKSDADEKQRIIALQQEINGLRRKQLEENARMKAQVEGGTAPININAPSDTLKELDRQISLNENVLRHLTVKVNKFDENPSVMMDSKSSDIKED